MKRLGDAGDGGRDIETRFSNDLFRGKRDLDQAKHYDHGLTQREAYPEMAKFFKQFALKTYPTKISIIVESPTQATDFDGNNEAN